MQSPRDYTRQLGSDLYGPVHTRVLGIHGLVRRLPIGGPAEGPLPFFLSQSSSVPIQFGDLWFLTPRLWIGALGFRERVDLRFLPIARGLRTLAMSREGGGPTLREGTGPLTVAFELEGGGSCTLTASGPNLAPLVDLLEQELLPRLTGLSAP